MKKVKVPLDTFVTLRGKVKFLEHYWAQYTDKMSDSDFYEYTSDIEQFISTRFFEQVDAFKINTFTKTVSIPQHTYDSLNKYAYISDDLLQVLNT